MEYLLDVLEYYSKEHLTLHNSMGDTVADVLVKTIRVIANMSVNSEVGSGLGCTKSLGKILLQLLEKTNKITTSKVVRIYTYFLNFFIMSKKIFFRISTSRNCFTQLWEHCIISVFIKRIYRKNMKI